MSAHVAQLTNLRGGAPACWSAHFTKKTSRRPIDVNTRGEVTRAAARRSQHSIVCCLPQRLRESEPQREQRPGGKKKKAALPDFSFYLHYDSALRERVSPLGPRKKK
jgi:hypothetical protein